MDLKHSILIRNEFTYRKADGQGTRGSTPGRFVTDYMSRPDACESYDCPRYFAEDTWQSVTDRRREAYERAISPDEFESLFDGASGCGGFAFSWNDLSLCHQELMARSARIQQDFERGKTIEKMVVSFDMDYLRQMKLVPDDFHMNAPGDLFGHVDHERIRKAVAAGLHGMSRYYQDLDWIGVFQHDTEHLHCHLCLVERGKGTIMPDGSQKGKILRKALEAMRISIHCALERSMRAYSYISEYPFRQLERQAQKERIEMEIACNQGIPLSLEKKMLQEQPAEFEDCSSSLQAMFMRFGEYARSHPESETEKSIRSYVNSQEKKRVPDTMERAALRAVLRAEGAFHAVRRHVLASRENQPESSQWQRPVSPKGTAWHDRQMNRAQRDLEQADPKAYESKEQYEQALEQIHARIDWHRQMNETLKMPCVAKEQVFDLYRQEQLASWLKSRTENDSLNAFKKGAKSRYRHRLARRLEEQAEQQRNWMQSMQAAFSERVLHGGSLQQAPSAFDTVKAKADALQTAVRQDVCTEAPWKTRRYVPLKRLKNETSLLRQEEKNRPSAREKTADTDCIQPDHIVRRPEIEWIP